MLQLMPGHGTAESRVSHQKLLDAFLGHYEVPLELQHSV